jgi:MYXO-CTERM domain-containing protein
LLGNMSLASVRITGGKQMKIASKALAVALTVTLATPAVAQSAADPAADPMMANPAPVENNEDDFPWGLLGLLGLAGLLGLKRRDRDDDTRRAPSGTGTGTSR